MASIKKYRDLESRIRIQVASDTYRPILFQLTTELLGLNPEYYTIWNIRRRCLVSGLLTAVTDQDVAETPSKVSDHKNQQSDSEILQSELAFTVPLLRSFPKCYWIWGYRQWILLQAIVRLSVPKARGIWEAELALTSKILSIDQRNFHAWSYRRIVVAKLESSELLGESMAEAEFAYTTKMIQNNLSNFSAWYLRSQVIPKILEERSANNESRASFLSEELSFVRGALDLDPEDQSLWNYHSFLVSQLVDQSSRHTFVPGLTVAEQAAYVRHEINEIKSLLEDYTNVKYIYQSLLEYTLALQNLHQPSEHNTGDADDLRTWLAKLRVLDPKRKGRWDDIETKCHTLRM
ncbi:hypothetical protein IL306_002397 [Fusarium sp. DS 682]|nr:hypothetical protein IL306_002397 [Fusarium sp. DS 682]